MSTNNLGTLKSEVVARVAPIAHAAHSQESANLTPRRYLRSAVYSDMPWYLSAGRRVGFMVRLPSFSYCEGAAGTADGFGYG
jgi:hypothetical protein